ncbi:MAG: hypothetical protein QM662_09515 [Gordonia sp. (in: high G+C Gram-positive bacteria)]
MAQHRARPGANGLRRRGVGRGLVCTLLSAVLIAGCVLAWIQIGNHVEREGDAAAASCVEGPVMVSVIADPDLAPGLAAIAARYTATRPVVHDRCVTLTVRPMDATVALAGLRGRWDTRSMGPYPAVWVPQSSVWAAELMSAVPDRVDGETASLVTSPVVLATVPELARRVAGRLDWGRLPALAARDDGLAEVDLPDWGSLRMALPIGPQADPSVLTAQAVAARVVRATGALTGDEARSARVTSAIRTLITAAPRSPDGTPAGAATMIADAPDPAAGRLHATPITEQRLYQLTMHDTRQRLAEVVPAGPAPIADFPVIRLKGTRVSQTVAAAVGEFLTFADAPEQLRLVTRLGFRGAAPLPTATSTVTFPAVADPMPTPETAAVVALNTLMGVTR